MNVYWPVALGIGAGTLLIRYSFILIMDKVAMPEVVHRMLGSSRPRCCPRS